MLSKELGCNTGIFITPEETEISWKVGANGHYEDYAEPRKYLLDNGELRGDYKPKARVPGQRWRFNVTSLFSNESDAFQCITMFREGYITVEERLTIWGLVMSNAERIQTFRRSYSNRPEEWRRVLCILNVREDGIQAIYEFAETMSRLDPVYELIPIRVLEIMTVFRVMFRLSLSQFELARDDSE
jgi:hypothetical protein